MSGPVDEQPGLPRVVRLGVDVGDVRVGLARSDLDGLIATPVETLGRDTAARRVLEEALELAQQIAANAPPRRMSSCAVPRSTISPSRRNRISSQSMTEETRCVAMNSV